jgi:SET domain-containing protein
LRKNFKPSSTRDSLQIKENKHQHSEKKEAAENFINHSCNPNGYIDFSELSFKAKTKIEPGEKLTFNYLNTEWELTNKFKCNCDSSNRYGKIKGFKNLSKPEKEDLKPGLSPFLKKKLERTNQV